MKKQNVLISITFIFFLLALLASNHFGQINKSIQSYSVSKFSKQKKPSRPRTKIAKLHKTDDSLKNDNTKNLAIKNDEQFQNILKQETRNTVETIKKLEKEKNSLSKEDLTILELKRSELFALKTLSTFEYDGLSKSGQVRLKLKDKFQGQGHKKYKTQKSIIKNQKLKKRVPSESSLLNLDLSKVTKLLNNDKEKESLGFANHETQIRNTFLDTLTSYLEKMHLVTSSEEAIHSKNIKIMDKILDDAYKRPNLYKVDRTKLNDVSDLDLPVYAQTIKNKISAKFGLVGGAISGTLSNQVLRFAKSAVLVIGFEAVKGLSFDSLFMAIAVNLGIKQLYALASYYRHLKFEKAQASYEGRRFSYKTARLNFNHNNLYTSDLFKKEMQKSWILGHFTMTFKQYYDQNQVNSKFFGGLALSAFSWIGTPSIIPMFFAMTRLLNTIITGKTLGAFLSLATKKFSIIPSWFSNFVKGPWTALSLPVDIITQSAAMFSLIHMRLHGATLIFDNVFPHPATIVHLSVNQKYRGVESFQETTKKTFMPLCNYFASINQIDHTIKHPEDKIVDLILKPQFQEKLNQCITLKYLLISGKKPSRQKIDFYYKREIENLLKHPHTFDDEENLISYVKDAYSYPEHYKVLWLTSIKAISTSLLEKQYLYALKNIFFLGSSDQKWFKEYFRYHIFELKSFEDSRRLEVMIETIAKKTNSTFIDTYIKFYENHFLIGKNISIKLKKDRVREEDSFINIFWKEVKSLKQSIIFAFESYSAKPSSYSYKSVIDGELIHFSKHKRHQNFTN